MPPRAMRARTRYRLSMRRPISGSVNVEATPEVYAETRPRAPRGGCVSLVVLLHVALDRGHIIPCIGGEPVLRDRTRALVVGPDRVLEVGGEGALKLAQDRDPGGDVVVRVEEVDLTAQQLPGPLPGGGDDLHRADGVRGGDRALVEPGLLQRNRLRERRVDPHVDRGLAHESLHGITAGNVHRIERALVLVR